jgi:hypothetical protein
MRPPSNDARPADLAVGALGVGRIVIGALALAMPTRLLSRLPAAVAGGAAAPWLARVAGVRDIALGLAAIAARRDGHAVARVARLGALCDATDAIVTLAAPGLPRRPRVAIAIPAAAAAASGVWAASRLTG